MIWLPNIDQVIEMHSILIRRTGGSDGIRDLGLIESALARASAGFGEFERYPSVIAISRRLRSLPAPPDRPHQALREGHDFHDALHHGAQQGRSHAGADGSVYRNREEALL